MSEFLRCRDCKHDKGKCVGSSRRGGHKNCFEPREITNADRIRAMSDEELANWLCRALDCDFCKAYLQNMSTYSRCENQVKGIFNWLQSPVEEDT